MKRIYGSILLLLAAGLCGALVFFLLNRSDRKAISQTHVASPRDAKEIESESDPLKRLVSAAQMSPKEPTMRETIRAAEVKGQKVVVTVDRLPKQAAYNLPPLPNRNEDVAGIFVTVSNAMVSVDRILRSQNYTVEEFSGTFWLTAEDRGNATKWRLFTYQTNTSLSSVEAAVYLDENMTVKDKRRSFRISLYPDSTLMTFSWDDDHELLRHGVAGIPLEYDKNLGAKKWLEMRWDEKGNLTKNVVVDWTGRGPIGVPSGTNTHPYRLGPTSSIEAATGSWRRKPE